MTIQVLLADDQELVRAGLRMMVDSAPGMAVVGEAATGRQAASSNDTCGGSTATWSACTVTSWA